MSHRIAISLAAAAIGISCIATDASARGFGLGGHGFGFSGGGHTSAMVGGLRMNKASSFRTGMNSLANVPDHTIKPRSVGLAGGGAGTPPAAGGRVAGVTGSGGGSIPSGSSYYVPASYSADPGDTACGRYPYPPCRKKHTKTTE
jgi:hypothetical protein